MKIERSIPGHSTFEHAMASIVGAEAWEIELKDQADRQIASLARRGDVEALFPNLDETREALAAKAEIERRSFSWIDPEAAGGYPGSDSPRGNSILLFACALPKGALLTGSVVLGRDTLIASMFKDEPQFLRFLEGLAAGVIRERGLVQERWAMHRLLASLAVHCIVVNRAGHVIVNTMRTAANAESTGLARGQVTLPMQRLIKQVIAQYMAAPRLRARPYHVFMVDLGSGEASPLYVLPLSKEDADGRPDCLALLLPLRSDPPCDATLTTAFSLTPAEAKVVRQMMLGKKTREIAEHESLTEQTVRTYLKRAYGKIGVSSQSELIAKVNELSVPLVSGLRQST